MSVRGIEIHNGYLDLPEGMPQTLHMGTEASPLTQGVADQIVVSAVINAVALGGTVIAGKFRVDASVDLTGNMYGVDIKAAVDDGIVVTGHVYGAYIQASMGDAAEIASASYQFEGIRVNMYAHTDAVLNGPIYGIHINNYIPGTPLSNYYFMRMSENGGITVEAALYVSVGGAGDITKLFVLAGTHTAWQSTGTPVGPAAGWIAVKVAGVDKAIQLYSV